MVHSVEVHGALLVASIRVDRKGGGLGHAALQGGVKLEQPSCGRKILVTARLLAQLLYCVGLRQL